jgi:type II secretory pathway component PulF
MPSYRYQCIDQGGGTAAGVLVAPDRASAMRQLQARGLAPLQLDAEGGDQQAPPAAPRPRGAAGGTVPAPGLGEMFRAATGRRRGRPGLKRTELANIIRELATAIEAGLPLLNALKTVRRQASGKGQPVILDFIIERVEAGRPLHEALEEYGPPFDEMIVGMVRASDASGRTAEVMHQLADLLDRSVELRREVIGATIYPLIVAALIGVSIIIAVTFLLPRLMAPILSQPGAEIPLPTAILLAFAGFMSRWWWVMVAGAGVLFLGFRRWIAVRANRRRVDFLLLRLPVVGPLLRDVAVARFTRTLGTLVAAGLPILSALRIVRDTLGNVVLMDAVDGVQEKVTTGQSLAEPLERCGFFPPLLVQIVSIGEKSGRLEPMLLHAAVAFDRQVNTSLKIFTKLLPPVLLVVMALVAAFVLSGILLPLLDMQKYGTR